MLSILGHLKMSKSTEDVLGFCANIAVSYLSDRSLCRFSYPPGVHAFMVFRAQQMVSTVTSSGQSHILIILQK